jgi:hypothetical protein
MVETPISIHFFLFEKSQYRTKNHHAKLSESELYNNNNRENYYKVRNNCF